MGLLDELGGMLASTGNESGNGSQALVSAALQMLSQNSGGLSGLVQTFQSAGLGDVISSWVQSGANLPISAEQIKSVLGSDQLSQFAANAGVSPDIAGTHLAGLLPSIVDKLTPGGSIAEGAEGDLMANGMSLLNSFFEK